MIVRFDSTDFKYLFYIAFGQTTANPYQPHRVPIVLKSIPEQETRERPHYLLENDDLRMMPCLKRWVQLTSFHRISHLPGNSLSMETILMPKDFYESSVSFKYVFTSYSILVVFG